MIIALSYSCLVKSQPEKKVGLFALKTNKRNSKIDFISLWFTAKIVKLDAVKKVEKKPADRMDRRPLASVNRGRLNDEMRQERRRELFKQRAVHKSTAVKSIDIKGVRLNRRFELIMKMRNAEKKN